ncbi:hypothetical protein [Naasia lichenicola]|uniref:Uncharacterized protein n=1 Tax=Naasia lichenicola TaxID=2565933 RepID=A0A4S4FRS8_9MICO|nr:hypothetical protein [Naasia lichenicola]THG32998.1 hypothetical protein E6C64_01115 [Naasia lichenicola]
MSSQGSNHYNAALDDQLKHEAQPIIQGHGPAHVEEWRQTVALPDDTDDPEAVIAWGIDGPLKEAPDDVTTGAVSEMDDRP